jgi:soluble lytic murein transglycosylase-like protein
MGVSNPSGSEGKTIDGKALAQWAKSVMMAADRRLLATMTSSEGADLKPQMPFIPQNLNIQSMPRINEVAVENASKTRHKERDFVPIIKEAAEKFRLPYSLIRAVIKAESAFNPKAVSHAGAQGLMQLMPQTAKTLGVTDSFDPRQNIHGGARYLRMMLNRYGNNVSKALAAYNWGPHRVDRDDNLARMPEETRNYLKTILAELGVN